MATNLVRTQIDCKCIFRNRALSRLTLLFKKFVLKLSHIVGIGNPMRKTALICVPPRKGFNLKKIAFPTGYRLKRFFYCSRTPYVNKHLNGWRGTEHRLVIHPTASLADLNGYSTRLRDIGGTRP